MLEPSFLILWTGWAGVFVFMLALWMVQLKTKNAAILDVGWAAGLAGLGFYDALTGPGFGPRKWLLASMVLFWGGRLALYLLFTRVLGGRDEDPRYTDMKKRWGRGVGLKLFLTFQFQGALDVFLSIPFLLVCRNPSPALSPAEWAGAGLWMIAVGGEALADFQLHRFKADPANRGKTCRAGLWNYSRHPNYFFEWLVWCAYALYAFASPGGWAGLACPLLMFYFLFRVTGIPLTEAQAVKTKGEDYLDYQRTTSVFVPWFRKNREAPRDR